MNPEKIAVASLSVTPPLGVTGGGGENRKRSFFACGREWILGKKHSTWFEAQSWIKSLEGEWCAPKREELKNLFASGELKRHGMFDVGTVWAESPQGESAWTVHMGIGSDTMAYRGSKRGIRGIAMRVLPKE
jgi:hypothetical protein